MGYKYAPISVDLSKYGEGLYARCLHPKLQPNSSFKAQQRAMTAAIGGLPPELLHQVSTGELDFETLPMETKVKLAPLLVSQLDAQDDLVAACILEWNLTDIYTGEALKIPRVGGKAVFEKLPGEIVAAIYNRLQEAAREETDPNS